VNKNIPDGALPIIDWDDDVHPAGRLIKGVIPLCPHCKQASYYTTKEAEARGGYTICPFCGGAMYMEAV
jgi:hypothetical protein